MHPVVLLGHVADGVQCRTGGHRDISDNGESLRGKLPAAPKQPPVRVVSPNQDREEQVKDMSSYFPVHPQERQLRQPQDSGQLGREAAQERVEPSSLPKDGREGGQIWALQSEQGRQSPDEIVGELARIEDRCHQPRRPMALGVNHSVWRPALPAAVRVRSGGGSGQRHQVRPGQWLGQAIFLPALPWNPFRFVNRAPGANYGRSP